MNKIAIIGAGGHTRSSINLLKHFLKDAIFRIYDENYVEQQDEVIAGIKLVGTLSDIKKDETIFLSIGDNKQRENYYQLFEDRVLKENLFHPTSYQENNIILQNSNQFYANSYINSYVNIGSNNIINTSAVLEHEVTIGDHNHISVGSKVCGRVTIGNRCFIGAGAIVIDKISICDDVTIGAGAVVAENIVESGTYVGVPARRIK